MAEPLLQVRQLHRTFGGLTALSEVSFSAYPRAIKGIIGPNGAGKTTLFNVISGQLPPSGGQVLLRQEDITHLPAHRIAARGIVRTFQNLRLFQNMSVLENVMMGRHVRTHAGLLTSFSRWPSARQEERAIRERAKEELAFLGLHDHFDRLVEELSFWEQRRVELARALATDPVLLLADEPAAGLNPVEGEDLVELLLRIRERGVAILLVEHDMAVVMQAAEEILVLDQGRALVEGKPQAVQNDPRVIATYLGQEAARA